MTDSLTDTDSAISDAPHTPPTPQSPERSAQFASGNFRAAGTGSPSAAGPSVGPHAPGCVQAYNGSGRQTDVGLDAASLHSYVQLWDTGLRFQPDGLLFYDDSAGVLHAVVGDLLYTYGVTSAALRRQGTVVHALGGAPTVKLVGMSPDWRLVALQRSSSHVEIMDSSTGNIIIQGPSQKRQVNVVLGFCWVTTPTVDFVLVTAAGLELYQRQEARAGHSLQLVDSKTHSVKWYKYSHETRVMLLSTGTSSGPCKLQAYQFNSRGILKLPSFEPACAVAPADASLVNLYGRVYCCVMDATRQRILLYRFYRNTVLLQHQYALYDSSVALSTVDGLLLLHHRTTRVTLVIDVCQPRQGPLGDPLPMTLQGAALKVHQERMAENRGATRNSNAEEDAEQPNSVAPVSQKGKQVAQRPEATSDLPVDVNGHELSPPSSRPAYVDLGSAAGEASFTGWIPTAATLYSTQWRFEQPNIILDVVQLCLLSQCLLTASTKAAPWPGARPGALHRPELGWVIQGIIYSVHVDLPALATCSSIDLPMLLGVLQRRTHPTEALVPRLLTVDLLRSALRRQTPLPVLLEAFSVLNAALKGALQAPQHGPQRLQAMQEQQPHLIPGAPVAVMTPQALHDEVLLWCVEQPDVDLRYITAVLHAYMLSMVITGIPAEPRLSCMLVDTLLRSKDEYQVAQLCANGGIPPSVQLAEHLLDLHERGVSKQGRQMALDVLQRHHPGAAQLSMTSQAALHYVLTAVSPAGLQQQHTADNRSWPAQLWLPAKDAWGNLNQTAVCGVRRVGVVSGRVPPMPLRDVFAVTSV